MALGLKTPASYSKIIALLKSVGLFSAPFPTLLCCQMKAVKVLSVKLWISLVAVLLSQHSLKGS